MRLNRWVGVTVEERFFEKVSKLPDLPGCWLWTGWVKHPDGYGLIRVGDRVVLAHRLSWELHVGEIAGGLFVLHHCDTRACVRPDHLYLGTNADNVRDRETRNRRRDLIGSANGRAKLSSGQVLEIRAQRARGATVEALSKQFGVSGGLVYQIVNRRVWTHV